MTNKHGEFVWYELMTRDPDGAKAFYDGVVGWNIGERPPGDMDYRIIDAGEGPPSNDSAPSRAGDRYVGGVLRLTDEMCAHGARAVWLGYVGADDVDATITKLEGLGGRVLVPAKDIPAVGRIAMVTDPQGVPFYVMRGMGEDGTSTAFKPMADGHCAWNELSTPDQAGALSFYGKLFGWVSNEAMPMGEMGDYAFLDHNGGRIGAVMRHHGNDGVPGWTYYFHVADIDAAKAKVDSRGGKILQEPHEVPGGEHIIVGTDPDGTVFALVGPRATAIQ